MKYAILVMSLAALPAAADPTKPDTVNETGIFGLQIGMTEAQTQRYLKGQGDMAVMDGSDDVCTLYSSTGLPGVRAVVQKGMLTRVDIGPPSALMTDKGIEIGSSEKEVRAAYPDVRNDGGFVENGQPWLDLYVQPKGRKEPGLRFVMDGAGNVLAIFAGGPSIEYREMCGG